MDEDRHNELKQELERITNCKSLYILFCEGFILPDSLKTLEQRTQLQHLLRKLNYCIEKSEKIVFDERRFYVSEAEKKKRAKEERRRRKEREEQEKKETGESEQKRVRTGTTTSPGDNNGASTTTATVTATEPTNQEEMKKTSSSTLLFGQFLNSLSTKKSDNDSKESQSLSPAVVRSGSNDNGEDNAGDKLLSSSELSEDAADSANQQKQKQAAAASVSPEDKDVQKSTAMTVDDAVSIKQQQQQGIESSDEQDEPATIRKASVRVEDVSSEDERQQQQQRQKDEPRDAGQRKRTMREATAQREFEASLIDEQDVRQAIFLEMQCFVSLEKILTTYCMRHCNEMLNRVVYFSISDKKNKSIALFDEFFFVLCRCKCAVALWNSIHEPQLYEFASTDFPFAIKNQLCIESKPIVEYNAKDLLCAIQTLSAQWVQLDYCIDLDCYIDLLMTRAAMLIVYSNNGTVHNMPRYRTCVKMVDDTAPQKNIYVANQDFMFDMGVYFYSYRKLLAKRMIFNTVTLYDMDFLFNHEHSFRIIARLGVDTSQLRLGTRLQEVEYETSIYRTPSQQQLMEGQGRTLQIEAAGGGPASARSGAMTTTGTTQDPTSMTTTAAAAATAAGGEDDDTLREQREREEREREERRVISAVTKNEKNNLKYLRDVYQSQVEFEMESIDQLRICYFINDEVVKFLSNPEISFRMLAWLQDRSQTLFEYGEDTMRLYRKICLNYCVMIGEDMIHQRKTVAKNQTIETVLKNQRGIKVFNKMQETLNIEPNVILPPLKEVYNKVDNQMDEKKAETLVKTRDAQMYLDYSRRLLLRRDEDTFDTSDAAAKKDENKSKKERDPFERREKRSRYAQQLPKSFDSEKSIYQRTNLTITQTLLVLKLVDAYFQNYFHSSFEEYFVIYEREFEEKYTSYTRSAMPLLVQTFNTFQLYYNGTMYDIGNIMTTFYVWLRIVDQFHSRMVCGHDCTRIFNEIFLTNKNYNDLCRQPLSTMLRQDKLDAKRAAEVSASLAQSLNAADKKKKKDDDEAAAADGKTPTADDQQKQKDEEEGSDEEESDAFNMHF